MKFKINEIVEDIHAPEDRLLIVFISPPEHQFYYEVIPLNEYNETKEHCWYSIGYLDDNYTSATKKIRKEKLEKLTLKIK